MRTRINSLTGQKEVVFEAELLSIGENTLTLKNEKQTEYKIAQIQFVNSDAELVTRSAMVFAKTYTNHELVVGEKYQATAQIVGPDAYVRLSHLPYSGDIATAADFDIEDTVVSKTVPADQVLQTV